MSIRSARLNRSAVIDFEDDEVALTNGAWRFDPFRRVQVWVPAPTTAKRPQPRCRKCGARASESCVTRSGKRTVNHKERGQGRTCRCGTPVPPRRRFCDVCREDRISESRLASRAREEAA